MTSPHPNKYEMVHKEIWKNSQYIITYRQHSNKFEFQIEDEVDCLVWKKEFTEPYITKLVQKVGCQELSFDKVSNFIRRVFDGQDIKHYIDIMYSNDAKSLVEKSVNLSDSKKLSDIANEQTEGENLKMIPVKKSNTNERKEENEEVTTPTVGKTIIVILQYEQPVDINNSNSENKIVVQPFPLSYEKTPPTLFFRNTIKELRQQIRLTRQSYSTGNFYKRESEGDKNMGTGLFQTGNEDVIGKGGEISTQNSTSEKNQQLVNELTSENNLLNEQLKSVTKENMVLRKVPGAIEYDGLLSEKTKLENNIQYMKLRMELLEGEKVRQDELFNEIAKKDQDLKSLKDEIRKLQIGKTTTNNNRNFFGVVGNNRNGNSNSIKNLTDNNPASRLKNNMQMPQRNINRNFMANNISNNNRAPARNINQSNIRKPNPPANQFGPGFQQRLGKVYTNNNQRSLSQGKHPYNSAIRDRDRPTRLAARNSRETSKVQYNKAPSSSYAKVVQQNEVIANTLKSNKNTAGTIRPNNTRGYNTNRLNQLANKYPNKSPPGNYRTGLQANQGVNGYHS